MQNGWDRLIARLRKRNLSKTPAHLNTGVHKISTVPNDRFAEHAKLRLGGDVGVPSDDGREEAVAQDVVIAEVAVAPDAQQHRQLLNSGVALVAEDFGTPGGVEDGGGGITSHDRHAACGAAEQGAV